MFRRFLLNFLLLTVLDECQPKKKIRKTKKIFKIKCLLLKEFDRRREIPKNKGFVKVIKMYPDDVFKSHFRMSRKSFKKLVTILKPYWRMSSIGRPKTSLQYALLVTIWRLANVCTFRDVADRFNIAKGTAYNCVMHITRIMFKARKEFIKWPASQAEYNKVMDSFQNMRSRAFPFVIGCIDGTHIEIPSPSQDNSSYYNRKGRHSIILQGVCDADLIFTDVYFGYPGRTHDAAVWRSSPLCKALQHQLILPEGTHLLGDSAYPLSTYLITPYRDNGFLTEGQLRFNACLSSTRVCIEQAFGILKSKFRILKYLNVSLKNSRYIVMACVALHNFIMKNEGCNVEEENVSEDEHLNEVLDNGIRTNNDVSTTSNEAREKRERILHLING